ncbi:hypothetical protein GGX14DRAFT_567812 [Mycena pura]|uniref:MOSC domain-containing protein n=1 Tax=Mycena pura TaxID=153505 RepID=A0AAD6VE94_9AGAR|nr:hypothetical protein GGX14DRAFT_567812 [Mycena pura]
MLGIKDFQSVSVPFRPLLLLSIGFASLFIATRATKRSKLLQLPFRFRKSDTIHGPDIRISRILVYPIKVQSFIAIFLPSLADHAPTTKSCAGIDLQSSAYDQEGFEFDRKWMIVDLEKNKQLSARDNRGIKLVRVFPSIKRDLSSPSGGVLEVTFPDSPDTSPFSVPLNPTPEQLSTWEKHGGFDLWGFSDEGYVVESADPNALETPSEILTGYVGRAVLLVMQTRTPRPVDELPLDTARLAYAGGARVRYPDCSPFLLVSEASLADAEAKVWAMARGEQGREVAGCTPDDAAPPTGNWAAPDAKRLLMERFRPNVVVRGVDEAFGEDDWQEIATADNHSFVLPMRCPRCMFPNVDTESGNRDPQMPNNAMMQYRKVEAAIPSKYCFGMYMIPAEDSGVLCLGDKVMVTRSAVNPKLLAD